MRQFWLQTPGVVVDSRQNLLVFPSSVVLYLQEWVRNHGELRRFWQCDLLEFDAAADLLGAATETLTGLANRE